MTARAWAPDPLELITRIAAERVVVQGQRFGLLFEIIEPLGQIAMRDGEFAQPHKSSHHVDRHLDRTLAAQHRCGHDRAVLRERQRQLAPAAPA